jgi:arabinose-5-phosphate isomerase
VKDKIERLIRKEIEAIRNIPVTGNFEKAVKIIYNNVHRKKSKLVCSGIGKAGQIALNIATTFSSTGTPAVFLHPAEAQHGDLGVLQPNDVLLLISNSGRTREIIELLELSKHLYKHIPTIVITGNAESVIARQADALLLTGNSPEIGPMRLVPTTSTTVMSVIGDILVVLTMGKIKFTKEQYSRLHHGGYIGSKTRKKK